MVGFRHQHTGGYGGYLIDALASSYSLQQLVNEPTHILPSSSSCIDLIFPDQPSLVVSSGAHPSLHANCHHLITYCKLNLKTEYTFFSL